MQLAPVESSNVAAVGYDPRTQTLVVEFHSGARYEYIQVPASEHAALVSAASVGSYLHHEIVPYYVARRVA